MLNIKENKKDSSMESKVNIHSVFLLLCVIHKLIIAPLPALLPRVEGKKKRLRLWEAETRNTEE